MGHVYPNRAGLAVAAILAGWHLVWSLLVALGLGQQVMDIAFQMHFMKSEAVIEPFNLAMAGMLLAVTAVVGYLTGAGLALAWNCLHWWNRVEKPHGSRAAANRPATPLRAS